MPRLPHKTHRGDPPLPLCGYLMHVPSSVEAGVFHLRRIKKIDVLSS